MRGRIPKITATQAIAWLALFASLGGSVYAAAKIDGKTIKKGSIPANRIKADSLTGAQVSEASLGIVPSASRATEAKRAETAVRALEAERAKQAPAATSATEAGTVPKADRAKRAEFAFRAEAAGDAESLGERRRGEVQAACGAGSVIAAGTVHPDPNGPNAETPEVRSRISCPRIPFSVRRATSGGGVPTNGEYLVELDPSIQAFPIASAFGRNSAISANLTGAPGVYRFRVFSVVSHQLLPVEPFSFAILRGSR